MPTVAVSLTPVDRARRRIELPVINADDSPSRNPCKVRYDGPQGRTFRNEPYGFKAVSNLPTNHAVAPLAVPSRKVPMMGALSQPESEVPPQPTLPPQAVADVRSQLAPRRHLMGALEQPAHDNPQPAPPIAPAPPTRILLSNELEPESQPPLVASPSAPRPPPTVDVTPPRGVAAAPITSSAAPSSSRPVGIDEMDESPPYSGPRVNSNFAPDAARLGSLPPLSSRIGSGKRPTVVVVKFKYQDGVFHLPKEEDYPDSFAVGDYVVVEGDRGEHVGRIEQLNIHHHHSTSEVGNVIRKAYPAEIDSVHKIRQQEPQITRQVQQLADEMDVAMRVMDTEVQTDRNKLTIYYVSKVGTPVDFRQLQRRLFREFRCRIWFVDWEAM